MISLLTTALACPLHKSQDRGPCRLGGGKAEVCERLHKDNDPRAVERANLKEFWDNAVEEAEVVVADVAFPT